MANADDLRRLAEEMAGAYEERVRVISDVKQATADIKKETGQLLNDFGKVHAAMSKELKAELAGFKSDLDAAEGERKKTDQGEVIQRSVDIANLLSDFDSVHQEMAGNLRAELARFKTDLDAAEDERKKIDQGETRETAEAWKGLLSAMQATRGSAVVAGPAKIKAKVTVKTVEEAIEEPVEEEEEVEEAAAEVEEEEITEEVAAEEDEEDLAGRILDLIEDNPKGLKMTQIADILDVENWRSLIPVIRELIDDEEIRKEGSSYFPPE